LSFVYDFEFRASNLLAFYHVPFDIGFGAADFLAGVEDIAGVEISA